RAVHGVEQHLARRVNGRPPDADVRDLEVAAGVGEFLAAPGVQHDVERLVEDGARLVDRDAEDAVLRELVAAPHTHLDAAPAHVALPASRARATAARPRPARSRPYPTASTAPPCARTPCRERRVLRGVGTIQERTARRGPAARGSAGHALQRHLVAVVLPVTR